MIITEEEIIKIWEDYARPENEDKKLPTYEEWRKFLKKEFFQRWQKSAILSKIDEYENALEEYRAGTDKCKTQRSFYKALVALHEAQINACSIIKYEFDNWDKIGNKKNRGNTRIIYNEWRKREENIRFTFFCIEGKEGCQ